jgi:hypothetical protein
MEIKQPVKGATIKLVAISEVSSLANSAAVGYHSAAGAGCQWIVLRSLGATVGALMFTVVSIQHFFCLSFHVFRTAVATLLDQRQYL